MKKFIYFIAGILTTLGATAFAANMTFTDQNSFVGSWFENAAMRMNQKGIITGYSDGRFGPSNPVNRAELAVMLDRFDSHIQTVINNKVGGASGTAQDAVTLYQANKIINNTLRFSKEPYAWYTSFVVLAESDLMKLDGPPEHYGSNTWEEQTNANLPNGYKLFTAFLSESGNPSYLHFKGEICAEDMCGVQKDQWYGPFY